MAIELGDVGITKLLINAGADLQALDETRWPTLSKWLFETYFLPDDVLLEIEHFSVNHHPTKKSPLLLAAELGAWYQPCNPLDGVDGVDGVDGGEQESKDSQGKYICVLVHHSLT
jgi:hypothetical protein